MVDQCLKIMLRQGLFGFHAVDTYLLMLLLVLCDCTVLICNYCVESFCENVFFLFLTEWILSITTFIPCNKLYYANV
jgi:hypothetical protein